MSLAAIIMNLTPVTPIPPIPKPSFVPTIGQVSAGGGGGESSTGVEVEPDEPERDEAATVGLVATPGAEPLVELPPPLPVIEAEIVVEPPPKFAMVATSLPIFVRATILHVGVISKKYERGNLFYFVAPFKGMPDEVFFSYLSPGSSVPTVDAGYGQVESNIKRVRPETLLQLGYVPEEGYTHFYLYTVDTSGMRGGQLVAHFWGTGKFQASGFVEVEIKDRPRQLL